MSSILSGGQAAAVNPRHPLVAKGLGIGLVGLCSLGTNGSRNSPRRPLQVAFFFFRLPRRISHSNSSSNTLSVPPPWLVVSPNQPAGGGQPRGGQEKEVGDQRGRVTKRTLGLRPPPREPVAQRQVHARHRCAHDCGVEFIVVMNGRPGGAD